MFICQAISICRRVSLGPNSPVTICCFIIEYARFDWEVSLLLAIVGPLPSDCPLLQVFQYAGLDFNAVDQRVSVLLKLDSPRHDHWILGVGGRRALQDVSEVL